MKTSIKIFAGIAVMALAFSTAGVVSADTIDIVAIGAGYGRGIGEDQDGLLADYMEAAIADGLGLTVEELNALEADGATHFTIALDRGFSADEFNAILENAQEKAVELAAADGIILQQFGQSENSRGKFGAGLSEDSPTWYGSRQNEGAPDKYGSGLVDAEDCLEETCSVEPEGSGMRRGGR